MYAHKIDEILRTVSLHIRGRYLVPSFHVQFEIINVQNERNSFSYKHY